MGIRKHMSSTNYTVVRNKVLQNDELHWKTRGLFSYMLSLPDDWTFYTTEIAKHSKHEGVAAVKSGLRELENNGYLIRIQPRNSHGQFSQSNWLLIDNPEDKLSEEEYAALYEIHDPDYGIGPQKHTDAQSTDTTAFSPRVENRPPVTNADIEAFSPQVGNRPPVETVDNTDIPPRVDFPPADKPQAGNRSLQSKHIQSKQEQTVSMYVSVDLNQNKDKATALIQLVENQWGPIDQEPKKLIRLLTASRDPELVAYVIETFNKNGRSKGGLFAYLTNAFKVIDAKGFTTKEEVINDHQNKFRHPKINEGQSNKNHKSNVIPIIKIGEDWD